MRRQTIAIILALLSLAGCTAARNAASYMGSFFKKSGIIGTTTGVGSFNPNSIATEASYATSDRCLGPFLGDNLGGDLDSNGCPDFEVVAGIRYNDRDLFYFPLNTHPLKLGSDAPGVSLSGSLNVITVPIKGGYTLEYKKNGNFFYPLLKTGHRLSYNGSEILLESGHYQALYEYCASGSRSGYYLKSEKSYYGATNQNLYHELTYSRKECRIDRILGPDNHSIVYSYEDDTTLIPKMITSFYLDHEQRNIAITNSVDTFEVIVPGHDNQDLAYTYRKDSHGLVDLVTFPTKASIRYNRGDRANKTIVKSVEFRNPDGGTPEATVNFEFCPSNGQGTVYVAYPTGEGLLPRIFSKVLEMVNDSTTLRVRKDTDLFGLSTSILYTSDPEDKLGFFSMPSSVTTSEGIQYDYTYETGTSFLTNSKVVNTGKNLYRATMLSDASLSYLLLPSDEFDIWNSKRSSAYDSFGRLKQITAEGHTTQFTTVMNSSGGYLSCALFDGVGPCENFNSSGLPYTASDPTGASSQTSWGVDGMVAGHSTSGGDSISYDWNSSQRLIDKATYQPQNVVQSFSYTAGKALSGAQIKSNNTQLFSVQKDFLSGTGELRGLSAQFMSVPPTTFRIERSSNRKTVEFSVNGSIMETITEDGSPTTPVPLCP